MTTEPNFLIIGAPKAGTTSLWELLGKHPEVFVCQPKEPGFFNNDEVYSKGWSWYTSLFEDAGDAKAIGEATTIYSRTISCPQTPGRIAKHLPDVLLIYVTRHPLEQIESHFLQRLHSNLPMPRSFPDAVREHIPLIEGASYWRCVSDYRKYFSDEQLHVLFFEDFKVAPHLFLTGLFRKLGVDDTVQLPDASHPRNPSANHSMDSDFLVMLRRIPGFRLVSKLFPERLKWKVGNRLRVPLPGRPEWDHETRKWVLDRVVPEAKAILEYADKPPDFWQLAM